MKPYLPLSFLKQMAMLWLFMLLSFSIFAQTKTRVTGAANWNSSTTWVKAMPGTVSCILISKTLWGVGTSFTTDFAPGDVITSSSGTEVGVVASITDDNTLKFVSLPAVLLALGSDYGVERVPGPLDDVEIGNTSLITAVNVSLNVATATVNSLTFIADNINNTLTHAGTNALTVSHNVVINQPTQDLRTISWNINGGTATVNGNINLGGLNTNINRIGRITITSGTLNANGSLIFSGSTPETKVIDMTGGAGSLNLKAALTNAATSATLNAGTSSIFNYTGTVAQTINYFGIGKYNNLYINNTNASGASLSAAITTANVGGNIAVGNNNAGSLFNTAGNAVAMSNARTVTVAANATLNAGTSIISFGTGTPALTINGTFKTANTNGFSGATTTAINSTNPPSFVLGAASTIEYNAAVNQTVTGRSDYANIAVSGGGTKTPNASITAASNMDIGTSTTFNASSYRHYMRGTLTSSGTFTGATSTMVFSGTGSQSIPGLTYTDLETSNSGTKTAAAGITVTGNMIIGSGTTFNASSYTHNLSGNITNNGSFAAGSSTFNFNGSLSQQINGNTSFNNITTSNPAELSISSPVTIGGLLTISNGRFNINGQTLTLDGSFSGSSSYGLKGSKSSNLIIGTNFTSSVQTLYFDQTSSTFNNYLKDFTVNKSIRLGNSLNISPGATPGSVTLATAATLTTNDYLSIKSDDQGTARVAALPVNGSGVATAFITGKVNIERYIPLGRGWRLLSTPVRSSGAPTINEAWQEGLTTASPNPNLYPGYGVKICGGSSANGYDTSATTNTFIKIYNSSTNTFVPLPPNPGTKIPISNYPAYFLYVRGDRSVNMLQGLAAAITSTTLRTKGQLITGKQDISVGATGFSLLGNPYASSIDFHTLTKNNVSDMMYVWDPKLAGNYGVGGYVTFIWNNTTHSYDATSSVSALSQYIQSGSAVMIASADNTNPGTVSVKESDKTANGANQSLRLTNTDQRLRVNMYMVNADSTTSMLDGVLTTYDDSNENTVDNNDAKKLYGSNQSINIRRDAKTLAIERRKTVTGTDTCFLNIYQMKPMNYQLEIVTQNMNNNGVIALLKDNYAAATNNLPLEMNGTTTVSFTVNADPASYAVNRFSIVFEPFAALPISFKNVKAKLQQENILVEWQTESEINTNYYDVERAADGRNFSKINTTPIPSVNTSTGNYSFIDKAHLKGMNYYRIVSVASSQEKGYSNIVKVNIDESSQPIMAVYPNPVTGNTINLNVENIEPGSYRLQIFNFSGQLVSAKTIRYDAVSSSGKISLNETLAPGKYQLTLSGEHVSINTYLIKK